MQDRHNYGERGQKGVCHAGYLPTGTSKTIKFPSDDPKISCIAMRTIPHSTGCPFNGSMPRPIYTVASRAVELQREGWGEVSVNEGIYWSLVMVAVIRLIGGLGV